MDDTFYQDTIEKISKGFEGGDIACAEQALRAAFERDDGTLNYLQNVKIPLLHIIGRYYYRSAKRYLRDAYIFSKQFPGSTPAWEQETWEEVSAFLRQFVGLETTE